MEATTNNSVARVPWNKDKLTGQKPPLKLREIWTYQAGEYRSISRHRSRRCA